LFFWFFFLFGCHSAELWSEGVQVFHRSGGGGGGNNSNKRKKRKRRRDNEDEDDRGTRRIWWPNLDMRKRPSKTHFFSPLRTKHTHTHTNKHTLRTKHMHKTRLQTWDHNSTRIFRWVSRNKKL
jgi:hypothetical protein